MVKLSMRKTREILRLLPLDPQRLGKGAESLTYSHRDFLADIWYLEVYTDEDVTDPMLVDEEKIGLSMRKPRDISGIPLRFDGEKGIAISSEEFDPQKGD